ncbi:hypothetical protein AMAG_08945 [Allomyces macrogynus ATCC 38327]|uniref:Uncharacterized protein n=1 Tax=Allomyces macrogynus (strain ATCC 38327) TaxID=578462 RepID=A0A0L0SN04_ALLM3|nr:hypothetical protein AMAG_08945 [Allomyces macrogynus ATCC 38327]|eukprot:KNE63883.1 hypothetical protein AMAG_08945 [Allomyces macrogynus ATCC 38327]
MSGNSDAGAEADYDFLGASDCDSIDGIDSIECIECIDSMGTSTSRLTDPAAAINPAGELHDSTTTAATSHDALPATTKPVSAPNDGHIDPVAAADASALNNSAQDTADCARDNPPALAPPPFLTLSVPPGDDLDNSALGELPDAGTPLGHHAECAPIAAENETHDSVAPLHRIALTTGTNVRVSESEPEPTPAAYSADEHAAVHLAMPLFGRDGDPIERRVVVLTLPSAQTRSLDDVVAAISAKPAPSRSSSTATSIAPTGRFRDLMDRGRRFLDSCRGRVHGHTDGRVVDGDICRGDAGPNGVDDGCRHGDERPHAMDGLHLDGDAYVHENSVGDGHVDGDAYAHAMDGGYIHRDPDAQDHGDRVDDQDRNDDATGHVHRAAGNDGCDVAGPIWLFWAVVVNNVIGSTALPEAN